MGLQSENHPSTQEGALWMLGLQEVPHRRDWLLFLPCCKHQSDAPIRRLAILGAICGPAIGNCSKGLNNEFESMCKISTFAKKTERLALLASEEVTYSEEAADLQVKTHALES